MIVTLNLLKKYIALEGITPKEIADKLTFAGVEVEEMFDFATGTNLVVGEVLSCEDVEGTHLHITKVNTGDRAGVIQIVCGAPNVRVGLKVIVALPGAKLHEIEIKKGIIKGIESNGMLCSLQELGVNPKYLSDAQKSGIEELHSEFQVGAENVLELLELNDTVLDLSILPNRPDLLGLYYVARELGTLFNLPVKTPTIKDIKVSVNEEISFKIRTKKCLHFSTQVVKDIRVEASPAWLQSALTKLGYKPVNNIVDISNYAMAILNQPIHMYDLDRLPKKALEIRDDITEKVVALDANEYEVIPGDIAICSKGKTQCIGGVMGLTSSSITSSTKNVVIEIATFDPGSIRLTSKRLNLISESSTRNTRGNNPYNQEAVFAFIGDLLQLLNRKTKFGPIVYSKRPSAKISGCMLSANDINRRLGTSLSLDLIEETLKRSYCDMTRTYFNKLLRVLPPSYRLDLKTPVDYSEEVIRLLGFDILPSEVLQVNVREAGLNKDQQNIKNVRELLVNRGLDEIISYTLISEELVKDFGSIDEANVLLNPLSDSRKFLRQSLVPSLIETAQYNASHQNKDFALFEVSDLYEKNLKHKELGIVLAGLKKDVSRVKTEQYNYFHVKGIIEAILNMYNINSGRIKSSDFDSNQEVYHYTKATKLSLDKVEFASFGELHPAVIKKHKLPKGTTIAIINLDVLNNTKTSENKFSPFSRFPTVERDLAFIVNKDVAIGDFMSDLKKAGSKLVSDVELFDNFILEDGRRSVAFRLYYSNLEHTLQDIEIKEVEDLIIKTVSDKYGSILRDGNN